MHQLHFCFRTFATTIMSALNTVSPDNHQAPSLPSNPCSNFIFLYFASLATQFIWQSYQLVPPFIYIVSIMSNDELNSCASLSSPLPSNLVYTLFFFVFTHLPNLLIIYLLTYLPTSKSFLLGLLILNIFWQHVIKHEVCTTLHHFCPSFFQFLLVMTLFHCQCFKHSYSAL